MSSPAQEIDSTLNGECIFSRSPEYIAWYNMMERCYNSDTPTFEHYGGKGIRVCERWWKIANFIRDMGRKPDGKYSLGRIDSNGDYEPDNCRWETTTQQNRNTTRVRLTMSKARRIRLLHKNGFGICDIAREFNLGWSTVKHVIAGDTWHERRC